MTTVNWVWPLVVAFVGLVALAVQRAYYLRLVREVFLRGTDVLTRQIGELRVQLEDARGRADRYRTKISEVLQEREDFHQLWQQQSIGHGNAQNMMMTTIEEMGRLLSQKGVRYRLNPLLQAVRDEYLEKHEMPARADLKKQEPQSPPPPPPEAA